ncbi:MAG: VWA domain-containing protein, partial [Clostridiales bacterium]|nr:VWA domain-containing protein [Clostridiales bacterium]
MSVQNLWPLAFLLLIPVIILLYILKQRAVERDFSSNLLWREIYRNLEATTPFEKLKRNILMYLQILLLVLLILALMSPFIRNGGKAGENLVIVMDTSGSMLYEHGDDGTRLDYSVKEAAALVDSADEAAVVTIISCDSEASIVYQGTDKITAKLRLNAMTAQEEAGTLDLAASLVNSVISGMDNVQVVCYTDTAFSYENLISSNEDAALSLVNAYSEGENCAVDYISYAIGEEGVTVLCKVTNYGSTDIKQDLSLYADGQIADLQSVTLKAGESSTYYFEDCNIEADGSAVIRAELSASDALDADNVQKAVVSQADDKRVLLLSDGNVFLEKALGLDDNVTVYKSDSLAVLNQVSDLYDLYVFDGISPSEDEEEWLTNIPENAAVLLLNQDTDVADFGGISVKSAVQNAMLSFYETDITNYLSDYSFGMTEAYTYTLPSWAIPLITTDDGDAVGYYGINGTRMVAVLGFDIHNSDIALQSEFPIFMSQLTSALLESSNETVEISNFPTAEESCVTPAEEGIVSDGGELVRSGGRSLRNLILLLAIALLVVEWIIYVRQVHTSKKRQFLVVRICVLACVVLAMAGISVTVTMQKAQTVFLVDVSDSMSGNLSEVEDYLQQTISEMPDKNSSAIVLFGKDTAVEEFMTDTKTFSKFTTTPVTSSTDIQNAVETACSMFDEGVTKRLVLITDGSENEGSMSLAASVVTAGEVELEVISMEDSISDGSEVYV